MRHRLEPIARIILFAALLSLIPGVIVREFNVWVLLAELPFILMAIFVLRTDG